MANKGKSRDWGYASYDVDRYDDYSDSNLGYTSYENSGSVNKYYNNNDGGHSHAHYNDSDNYNLGKEADFFRKESNNSPNPSIAEIQDKGGCYLTSACIKHKQENFDDNCEELTILRWFRDRFVSAEDINQYYITAPIIVEAIDKLENNDAIYDYIYTNVIDVCVKAIKSGKYELAYNRYKSSIIALKEQYIRKESQGQPLTLKLEN